MNSKRPFAPELVSQFDEKLLKNKPGTWSARTHMVWYYCIIYFLLIAAFSFLFMPDVRQHSAIEIWSVLVSLISFVGLIFWLIYLLRFNEFKRFAIQGKWDGLKTYALYFIAIVPLIIAPFIPSLIETNKANNAYTSDEIIGDINDINVWVNQLEKDYIPQQFEADTFIVNNKLSGVVPDIDYANSDGSVSGIRRYRGDSASLRYRIETEDSSRQINDSLYVFYKSPDYVYIQDYRLESKTVHQFESKEIYSKVFGPKEIDKPETSKKLQRLIDKYSIEKDLVNYSDQYSDYKYRIRDKYKLNEVDRNIGSITEKKYRWDKGGINIFVRVFYYVTLILSLLVFAFRHCTMRTFFLTLLSAVLLAVLTAIFFGLTNPDEAGAWILLLVYYAIFLVFAFVGSKAKIRSASSGIGINLLLWSTPFVPLVLVALYYSILKKLYYQMTEVEKIEYFKNESLHFLIAEISGLILLLIVIEPIFKKLYTKWYSTPEQ